MPTTQSLRGASILTRPTASDGKRLMTAPRSLLAVSNLSLAAAADSPSWRTGDDPVPCAAAHIHSTDHGCAHMRSPSMCTQHQASAVCDPAGGAPTTMPSRLQSMHDSICHTPCCPLLSSNLEPARRRGRCGGRQWTIVHCGDVSNTEERPPATGHAMPLGGETIDWWAPFGGGVGDVS